MHQLLEKSGRAAWLQGPSIDRAAILNGFENDKKLMAEIIGLFMDECPNMVHAIRDAIQQADAPRLARAAHTLKGSMGYFGETPACESARRLELLANSGELAAASMVDGLEDELEQLTLALAELLM